jgi:hypothetical protein
MPQSLKEPAAKQRDCPIPLVIRKAFPTKNPGDGTIPGVACFSDILITVLV